MKKTLILLSVIVIAVLALLYIHARTNQTHVTRKKTANKPGEEYDWYLGSFVSGGATNRTKIVTTNERGETVTMYLAGVSANDSNVSVSVHPANEGATAYLIYPKLQVPAKDLISLTNAVEAMTNEPIFRIDQYSSNPIRVFVHTGTTPGYYHHFPFELTPDGWKYTPLNP